jgi:hypothetical protein
MTKLFFSIALMAALPGVASNGPGTMPTLNWKTSFDAARAQAQTTGKPILLLHLFGRFDDELC